MTRTRIGLTVSSVLAALSMMSCVTVTTVVAPSRGPASLEDTCKEEKGGPTCIRHCPSYECYTNPACCCYVY